MSVVWNAFAKTAQLSTIFEILISLPLTLATLSQDAFLLLSFLLTMHSVFHSSLKLILPNLTLSSGRPISLPSFLPLMQIPVHPFLLLLSFNLFSSATGLSPYITTAARWWGTFLRYSTPFAAGLEGLASLIVIQSAGLRSKDLATQSEGNQLLLLIASASAYVGAAAWLLSAFADAASTPITAMLFGCAVTSLFFLTSIGFSLRRTNVVESSGVALFLAYNVWQCTNDKFGADILWPKVSSSYSPLLGNMIPHLQNALGFFTHTLPRPVLAALIFRLTILHFASRVVARMTDDRWGDDDATGEGRTSSSLTTLVLTYRQTIFISVYSHLLLIDHYSDVWWRWTNVFFTLTIWAVELLVWGADDEAQHWKVD